MKLKKEIQVCIFPNVLVVDKYKSFQKLKKIDNNFKKYSLFLIQSNKDDDYFVIINKKKIINIQQFKRKNRIDKIDMKKDYLYIDSKYFKKLDKMKRNKNCIVQL